MLARDKPSGSSTRSRAAGSVAGNHAREAPAGGQSARSRKPSVKGLASCGSPVSSGERGLIAAASAYLCSLFERINPHQLPSRNRTSSLHDRHRGRSTRCEGGMRTVGGGSSTQSTPCPPPPPLVRAETRNSIGLSGLFFCKAMASKPCLDASNALRRSVRSSLRGHAVLLLGRHARPVGGPSSFTSER